MAIATPTTNAGRFALVEEALAQLRSERARVHAQIDPSAGPLQKVAGGGPTAGDVAWLERAIAELELFRAQRIALAIATDDQTVLAKVSAGDREAIGAVLASHQIVSGRAALELRRRHGGLRKLATTGAMRKVAGATDMRKHTPRPGGSR